MSMQKEKGKSFETKIANLIHEFLMEQVGEYKTLVETVNNKNLHPKRDFSSGTFTNSNGDIDLGLAKKFMPFSIECKHHKDLDLSIESIFKDKIKKIYTMWDDQVSPNANRAKLYPLLVFKANRTNEYAFFDVNKIDKFDLGKLKKYIKIEEKILCLFTDFLDVYFNKVEVNE